MLKKDPNERYNTALEIINDLENIEIREERVQVQEEQIQLKNITNIKEPINGRVLETETRIHLENEHIKMDID